MNRATELLQKAGTFYIATTEGDQPRVRPFGAVAEIDGKTYLSMNNTKKVFNQLLANPKVEICGMFDGANWFRITAIAAHEDTNEARAEMLKQQPNLAGMYKVDDGVFAVIALSDVHGTVESFGGPKEEF
jgi:uncharacterized pyridoxamine 5'-phosphate oxidase family protein